MGNRYKFFISLVPGQRAPSRGPCDLRLGGRRGAGLLRPGAPPEDERLAARVPGEGARRMRGKVLPVKPVKGAIASDFYQYLKNLDMEIYMYFLPNRIDSS